MMQPTRPRRPRFRTALASLVFAFALTTCDHPAAGPGGRAALAVQVVMPASPDLALFNLTIDNVRLIVVRPPSDTVFNQVFFFPPDQTDLPLEADIPMQTSPETFRVTIELLSGTQVLFSGTQDVSLSEGTNNPPAQLPVTYSGPGQNVATLTIGPLDSVLTQGGTLQFRLTAQDAQGAPVSTFYASWTTSDTMIARVDATGLLTAPFSRSTVNIQARTPSNVSVSTPITFIPTPIAINIVSGCGQSGSPGAQLPQPIVARVVAGDGLGVKGVQVQFTAPTGGSVATPLVVTDDNGLAQTLATLPPQGAAAYSIGATGLTTVTCNQTVLGATHLVFSVQPSNIVAGGPITVAVTAMDALDNPVTSFTGAVSLGLAANPGGITFGTPAVAAVAGVATFTGFTITGAAVGYSFVASSGSLTPATSTPFDVVPGAPAQLSFTVQPSGATQGVPIVPPPQVVIQDAFGNPATTATDNVTIDIGANPGGSLLGGTPTQAAIAGVATFPGLTLNELGTGYTLIATSGTLTPATSAPFNVVAVPATLLVFTTQPSSGSAGTPPGLVVITAQDGLGNTVTGFTGSVSLALGTHPIGATLGGTVTAVAGVATFTNLGGLTVAGAYTLVASAPGLQSVESVVFTVSPGPPAQLAFIVEPSPVAVGLLITPPVQVAVEDAFGNLVDTATSAVTVAIGANPGTATLGGQLGKTAVAGIATFTDLTLDQAGTGYTLVAMSGTLTSATSTTFNVTAGAVTQFDVVVTPPSVTAGTPATIVVTAQDGSGAMVTGYLGTVHFTSTDQQATLPLDYTFTTGDNGTHTFTGGATLRTAGSQSITAADLANGSITGFRPVGVAPAAASQLIFTAQPTGVLQGAIIAPPVQVDIHDPFGNLVVTATNSVTMTIGANPGAATLGGTTIVGASSGAAIFDDLTLSAPGSGFTLVANAPGLGSVESAPFGVLPVASGIAWNNPAGGNWSVPGNWSPTRVPGKTDTVFINLPGTYTVTLDVDDTVAFLSLGGGTGTQTLVATGRTFGIDSAATVLANATVTLTNTTINGGGSLVSSGSIAVAPGTSVINATLTNNAGGMLQLNGNAGPATLTVATGFTNAGTLELTGTSWGGSLTVTSGILTNASNATIQVVNGAGNSLDYGGTFDHQGTLQVGGPLTLVNAGSTVTTTTGTLDVATGQTLTVNNGTLVVGSGTTLSGLGTISLTGTTTLSLASAVTFASGMPQWTFPGAVTVSGPGTLTNQTTLVLSSDVVNADLVNQGSLEVPGGTSSAVNGALTQTGTVRLNGNAGPATLTVAAGFTNAGTLELTGTSWGGSLTVTSGTLTNASNATIRVVNGAGNSLDYGGTFDHQGTLQVGGPLTLVNAGSTVTTTTGTLDVATGQTLTVNNGTLVVGSGTTLSGLGTISLTGTTTLSLASAVTFAAGEPQWSFPGTVTVNGPGTLTNQATLVLSSDVVNAGLVNQGTLEVPGGTSSAVNGALTQTGTVRLNGNAGPATLTVATGFTNAGTIELTGTSWGGQLTVTSGTLTNAVGALVETLNGAGNSVTGVFLHQGDLVVGGPLTFNNAGQTLSATTGAIDVATGQTLTVSGGTLVVGSGTTLSGLGTISLTGTTTLGLASAVTFAAGAPQWSFPGTVTVNGPGTLTNQATLVLSSDVVNANLENQGTLEVPGGTSSAVNGALTQTGTVRLNGNAGPATLTVATGFTNAGTLELTGTSWGGQLIVSTGTLTNAVGALVETLNGAGNSVTGVFLHQGDLAVGGPLTFNNAGQTLSATTGAIDVATGQTLTVSGGTLVVGGGTTLSGLGTISLTGTTTLGLASAVTFAAGEPQWAFPGAVTVNGPGTLTNQTTLVLSSDVVNANLENQGTLEVPGGTSSAVNGALTQAGTVRLNGNAGPATLTVGAGFTNAGTIELTGTSWGGQLTVTSGTLTNAGAGTLHAVGGAGNSVTGILDNQGTVLVDGPLTIGGLGSNHVNSGTIAVGLANLTIGLTGAAPSFTNDGTITIGNGRTCTVTGGDFTNSSAGVLQGAGTLNVAATTFINGGTVAPGASPGILTVTGPYPSVSSAVVNIELGGTTLGTQYDQLAVSGAATLGGVLNVSLTGGFTPALTDVFTIMTYASQTGSFSQVNLPPGMQAATGPTGVVLTVMGGGTPLNAWVNASGGAWNTPGNWSTGVVPAAGDSAVIDLAGTYSVTLDVNPTVLYLTIGGGSGLQTLSSTSHTLTVNGATAVEGSGALVLTNSTLGGVGSLENRGTIVVRGTSAISGNYTSGVGSLLRMEGNGTQGNATLTLATGFTNNGAIELTNADPTFQRNAALNVTTGTLLNPATRTIAALVGTMGGTRTLNAQLNNQGTLSVVTAQGLTSTTSGSTHTNSGTIDLSGGSFTVNQSGTSSFTNSGSIQLTGGSFSLSQGSGGTLATTGAVTIGTGRAFSVSGGTFNVNTGASISGAGTLVLSSTTANLTPNFDNSLTALTLSGSTLNGPGTLTNTIGKTLVLLNSTLGATLPVINQGTIAVNGTSAINGSYTSGTGSTLRMEGNGAQGNGTLTVATGFTNNGAIELTNADPTFQRNAALNVTTGTLLNPATRTITALVGTMGGTRTLNAQLNNQGTLSVVTAQGLTSTTSGSTHTNSGTIDLSGGSFTVNLSGTSSFTNSGSIQLTGGSFSLSQGSGGTLATTGAVTIGTGRSFSVTGGTFNVNTGASISGAGTLVLSSTTGNLTPNFDNSLTTLTLSSSTVNGPGTLTNTTGKTLVLLNGTLGATLPFINQGTVLVNGTSAINGSYTSGVGSLLRMEGNGTQGNATLTLATGFTNNGAIELTNADPTFQRNAALNVTTGTLLNPATRTIAALVGTMGGTRTLNAQINNQGTLAVVTAQGLTSTTSGSTHTNSGTIDLSGGSFTVNQSGTSSFTNSGSIQLTGGSFTVSQASGGMLTTTGSVTASAGRTFGVTGGTFNFNTGATIAGAGTLELSSTTANLTPNFDNSLTTLTLSSSTVNGPGTLTNTTGKTLVLLNSTLGATLPVINQGTIVVNGTSAINGSYTSGTGSTLRMQGNGTQGNATLTMANGFTNNGAIELTNADPTFQRNAALNVTTGTLQNPTTRTITALVGTMGGTRTLNAQLANQGTLSVVTAQGLTSTTSGSTHTNSGTIDLSGGSFTVNQSGTSSFTNSGSIQLTGGSFSLSQGSGGTLATTGAVTIGTGRSFTVTGGTFNVNTGSAVTGAGALALSTTTANLTPNFDNGLTTLSLSFSTVNGPGTLTNTAGKTLVLLNSTLGVTLPFVNQGTVVVTNTSAINGSYTSTNGSTLRVEGNGTQGAAFLTMANGFTNNGAIELTNTDPTFARTATLTVSAAVPGGTLLNSATGIISSLVGTLGGSRALNAQLDNQGTLTVAQALTVNKLDADHMNAGLIKLAGGDLTVTLSGTRPALTNTSGTIDVGTSKFIVTGSGTFINQGGGQVAGTLTGSGTIDIGPSISFITNGITTVGGATPGTLTFVGPYLQGPSPSVMNVRIGGNPANPGVDYDQLNVVDGAALGNATLQGGILNISAGANVQGKTYVIIQLPAGRTFTGSLGVINIVSGFCDVVSPSGPVGNQYLLTCS